VTRPPESELALRRRLGDILVARGVLTADRLRDVLADQRRVATDRRAAGHGAPGEQAAGRQRLGVLLVEQGLATEEQVAEALGELLGREVVDASQTPIDPAYARLVPRALAERGQVLVLGVGERGLRVLAADPTDVLTLDDVRRHAGVQRLEVLIGTPTQLRGMLDRVWSLAQTSEVIADVLADPEPSPTDDDPLVADAPTVRLLDSILADAVRNRASDVHVEQQSDAVRIRYRVDGVLRDVVALPKSVGRVLTARIKVVSGMDIAERRVPQDGRIRLAVDGGRVDARVSTLPSVHGEKVVVRLLPAASSIQRLGELGLDDDQRATMARALSAPQGLVLITGPTGSGKTNTLYAAIAETITAERNVVTLEDPVEIEMAGITQVPVEEKTGMTFARGLRALLRQDPDVILVGEVRDSITAELALRAAMTGHLVLTTLHTNDAVAALPRLVDMGVEPYLVASALSLVVGQRLVRVPCAECAEPYAPDDTTLAALEIEAGRGRGPAVRGDGCPAAPTPAISGGAGSSRSSRSRRDPAGPAGPPRRGDPRRAREGRRVPHHAGAGPDAGRGGGTTYEEVLRATRSGL
jgi:type IV pilus assembly protein PilB